MRELVTRFDPERGKAPRRFEPCAAEIFSVDVLPDRIFLALAVGEAKEETGCFCRECFFFGASDGNGGNGETSGKRICERGRFVCRSYERADGRQVIVREKLPFAWEEENGAGSRARKGKRIT